MNLINHLIYILADLVNLKWRKKPKIIYSLDLLYFSLIFYSDLARQQDLMAVELIHQHR
jgi:hypothetical protein